MQIKKFEEYKKIWEEKKIVGNDCLMMIAKDIFNSHGYFIIPGDWEKYLEFLSERKTTLRRAGLFLLSCSKALGGAG